MFNYTVNWIELTNAVSSIYLDIFILVLLIFLPYIVFILHPSKFTVRVSFFTTILAWIFSHFWFGKTITKISLLTMAVNDISIAISLQNLLALLTTFQYVINLIYGATILLWGLLWVTSYIQLPKK